MTVLSSGLSDALLGWDWTISAPTPLHLQEPCQPQTVFRIKDMIIAQKTTWSKGKEKTSLPFVHLIIADKRYDQWLELADNRQWWTNQKTYNDIGWFSLKLLINLYILWSIWRSKPSLVNKYPKIKRGWVNLAEKVEKKYPKTPPVRFSDRLIHIRMM